jgi:PAS domain S-box-containing protein
MPSMSDRKLWLRLVLVGLAGALPLFLVSVYLINSTYETPLTFIARERQGIAMQRPLEHVLELLPRYVTTARDVELGQAKRDELSAAQTALQTALNQLFETHRSGIVKLHPAETETRPDADESHLTLLQGQWDSLNQHPSDVIATIDRAAVAQEIAICLQRLMTSVIERSNLVLDDDSDSYSVMDIAMLALPEAQQLLLELIVSPEKWTTTQPSGAAATHVSVTIALLRDFNLTRVTRDVQRAIQTGASFNGENASLQARLLPNVEEYTSALESLTSQLEKVAGSTPPTSSQLQSAAYAAWRSSFGLFEAGADTLDELLTDRSETIRRQRATAYAILLLTLLVAIGAMGMIIRGLLKVRYGDLLRVQDQLRAKEAQLRALGDNLPGGIVYQVVREPNGAMRFLYVSAGVETLHGVGAEAVLANSATLYDLLLAEDVPALRAAELTSFETKTPFKIVARSRRHGDGAVRFLEFAAAPRTLGDGRVIWDGIQMDVTERHLAEEAQRETQQQFSLIFDHSPMPITLSNAVNGQFVAVNDSFLRTCGYARGELVGRTSLELGLYADPSQRDGLLARLHQAGQLRGAEVRFKTKSGELRDHLLWLNVLNADRHTYILATALDVTDRNAATQEQLRLEEQLRQAQKLEALGTLAGGIAHDFNNVLGAIISFAELSKLDNPDNRDLTDNLDQILHAGNRAKILVRQILSFSRRQKEARENLQVAPIVTEALSLLRATLPATIAIERSLNDAVGDVLANGTQVHQVIMNLCTNAAHAMAGKGTLGVELTQLTLRAGSAKPHVELEARDYVKLVIRDTGHGMDEATLGRVFEPFFTTKRAGEGTGLGLSVVHGIIKDYGGVITVDSMVGVGTTFTIYLPTATSVAPRPTVANSELPRGNHEQVLFVDDEPALGRAASQMLERLGYRPTVFQSSHAALSAFRASPGDYRVLISDSTMPGITGIELLHEAHSLRPELRSILVSGSVDAASSHLNTLGCCQILSKPLSYAALAHALHRALAE